MNRSNIINILPKLKIDNMYDNGNMIYAMRCDTNNVYVACNFLKESYKGFGKRMKVPTWLTETHEFQQALKESDMSSVYFRYSVNLHNGIPFFWEKYDFKNIIVHQVENIALNLLRKPNSHQYFSDITEQCNQAVDILSLKLVVECAKRDHREFNHEGIDPAWRLLGDTLFVAYHKKSNWLRSRREGARRYFKGMDNVY